MGIYGSGWQARSQLEALAASRKVSQVTVWSRDPERRRKFCDEMTESLGLPYARPRVRRKWRPSPEILVTATSSEGAGAPRRLARARASRERRRIERPQPPGDRRSRGDEGRRHRRGLRRAGEARVRRSRSPWSKRGSYPGTRFASSATSSPAGLHPRARGRHALRIAGARHRRRGGGEDGVRARMFRKGGEGPSMSRTRREDPRGRGRGQSHRGAPGPGARRAYQCFERGILLLAAERVGDVSAIEFPISSEWGRECWTPATG